MPVTGRSRPLAAGSRLPALAFAPVLAFALAFALAFPPAVAFPLIPAPAAGTRPGTAPEQAQKAAAGAPSTRLDALLFKAAEYCRMLESAAFEFACREEISETIDPALDAAAQGAGSGPGQTPYLGPTLSVSWVKKIKRKLVYGYQCVRAGGVLRELRTLVEENGQKKDVPNARLETPAVDYGAAFLGPARLFGERARPGYVFTIAGEEKIGDAAALVVEAKPGPESGTGHLLGGKAWVDPATGEVLKLEWSDDRAGRSDVYERRGRAYKRTPRIVVRAEFGVAKNGLRFPSRLSVEEAYLKDSGKAAVRSRTEAVYKGYEFFAVEFEARD
jgi:hypothetical protein